MCLLPLASANIHASLKSMWSLNYYRPICRMRKSPIGRLVASYWIRRGMKCWTLQYCLLATVNYVNNSTIRVWDNLYLTMPTMFFVRPIEQMKKRHNRIKDKTRQKQKNNNSQPKLIWSNWGNGKRLTQTAVYFKMKRRK